MKTTFKSLMELFDSKVDYKVIKETNRLFKTTANIEGRDIVFSAVVNEHGEHGVEIDVEFTETIVQRNGREVDTYDLTGSGGEIKVFSMVGASLREMADRYHPDIITFTAEKSKTNGKETRSILYERLVSKVLSDYHVDKRDIGSSIKFYLYKK